VSLIIAVPRERRPSERRVALDPSRVERLLQQGLQVHIEADCGHTASFHDDDYHEVGVFDSFAEAVAQADVVVKVVCPDHLPRTTRAQPMDALSSQATVAGYKGALLAAELSARMFPMLTTAAGTIQPSRVLVIGAGVAGLQAIATARRLGAQVEAYDIRRAAKEQIESLGARMIDTGVEVEGAGGYARALRKDEKQKQHDVLAEHLAKAHVVICAASIPGRPAPKIITEDMVDGMLPESVIVDLAASTGGNCELTRIGEHYHHNDTIIVGPLNLPSHGAVHASEMYARNVHSMLKLVIRENEIVLDPKDEIIARCIVCDDGNINHAATATRLETEHVVFGGAVHVAADLAIESAGWLEDADAESVGSFTADSTIAMNDKQAADKAANASKAGSGSGSTSHVENRGGNDGSDFKNSGIPGATAPNDSQRSANNHATQAAGSTPDQSLTEPSHEQTLPLDPNTTDELKELDRLHEAEDLDDLQAIDGVLSAEEIMVAPDDAPSVSASDDLTQIEGVGPALQERLYAFGFRRWEQLAGLDDSGIEKLSVQLELGDEVKDQDWAGQARQLMETEQ